MIKRGQKGATKNAYYCRYTFKEMFLILLFLVVSTSSVIDVPCKAQKICSTNCSNGLVTTNTTKIFETTNTTKIFDDNRLSLTEKCCIMLGYKLCEANVIYIRSYKRSKTTTIVYTSVTIVSSTFGLLGNAAVLSVAYHQKGHLRSGKLHIAELATVNFVFSLLQLANVIPLYWTNVWIYTLPMCKIMRTAMELGSLVTIGFMVIIAIERYLLITYPVMSKCIERRYRHSLVVANAVITIATVVPFAIGLGIDDDGKCIVFHGSMAPLALPYNCFVINMYSAIPIFTSSILYVKIVRRLSKPIPDYELCDSDVLYMHKRTRANRRITFITMLTLGAFIICTLPTRVIETYIEAIDHPIDVDMYMALAFVAYVTYPLQSTLNPILFSMVGRKWRKEMKQIAMTSKNKILNTFVNIRNSFVDRNETEL